MGTATCVLLRRIRLWDDDAHPGLKPSGVTLFGPHVLTAYPYERVPAFLASAMPGLREDQVDGVREWERPSPRRTMAPSGPRGRVRHSFRSIGLRADGSRQEGQAGIVAVRVCAVGCVSRRLITVCSPSGSSCTSSAESRIYTYSRVLGMDIAHCTVTSHIWDLLPPPF